MRYTMKCWTALMVLALFATAPAHALDGPTIDRWISAMYEFNAWGARQPEGVAPDRHQSVDDPTDMQAMMGEIERSMAEAASVNKEVREIVQRHGFADPREWSEISGRIFRAFFATEVERTAPEMEREMADALREIEENPDIPEEHKANMRAMMKQQMGIMAQTVPDVSDRDRAAVMSRVDELKALFEE